MYHFLLCNCSQRDALIALFAAMNFKLFNHETNPVWNGFRKCRTHNSCWPDGRGNYRPTHVTRDIFSQLEADPSPGPVGDNNNDNVDL